MCMYVCMDRCMAEEALLNSQEIRRVSGQSTTMFPYLCGACCYCSCCKHLGCVQVCHCVAARRQIQQQQLLLLVVVVVGVVVVVVVPQPPP